MEIIRHTASAIKDEDSFNSLLKEPSDGIELDFVFNKDLIPIWTHSSFKLGKLSLYDILEINNSKKKLFIEFKYVNRSVITSSELEDILNYLSKIDNIAITSFNLNLIKHLVENRSKYPNLEIGLIINLFKRSYFKEDLTKLDFVSMASELWELTDDYKKVPNIKKYAWSWDAIYKETPKRIENYIKANADGVIVNDIEQVKTLIKINNVSR